MFIQTPIHLLRAGHVVAPKVSSEPVERVVVEVTCTSDRYYRIRWDDGTVTRRGPKAKLGVVGLITKQGRYEADLCGDPDKDGVTDWAIVFRPREGGPGSARDIATFSLYPDGLTAIDSKRYEFHIETTLHEALAEAVDCIEIRQAWLAHRGRADDGSWMWSVQGGPWLDMPGSWRPRSPA
jgi:hypothetical protein